MHESSVLLLKCEFAVDVAIEEDEYLKECFKDLDPAHQKALKTRFTNLLFKFVKQEIDDNK